MLLDQNSGGSRWKEEYITEPGVPQFETPRGRPAPWTTRAERGFKLLTQGMPVRVSLGHSAPHSTVLSFSQASQAAACRRPQRLALKTFAGHKQEALPPIHTHF